MVVAVRAGNGVFRICFIFYFLPVRLRERDRLIILGEIRERLTVQPPDINY